MGSAGRAGARITPGNILRTAIPNQNKTTVIIKAIDELHGRLTKKPKQENGTSNAGKSSELESNQRPSGRQPIPATTRQFIKARDQGRCQVFVDKNSGAEVEFGSPNARQCSATHFLQIDHILPVARGGGNNPENLRLCCAAHNQVRRY